MINNIEILKKEYKKYYFRVEKSILKNENIFVNFRNEVAKQRKSLFLETPIVNYYDNEISELVLFTTNKEYTPRLEENYPFLRNLLFTRSNGVASAGATLFKKDDFEMLIKNDEFMNSLKEFIMAPCHRNFTIFSETWKKLLPEGTAFPAICVNRVACACSNLVSSFPEPNRFHKLFRWLCKAGILDAPKEAMKWDWYTKNIFAFQQLKKLLEVGDSDFELNVLGGFFWGVYDVMILNDKLEDLKIEEAKGIVTNEGKKVDDSTIKEIVRLEIQKLGEYADLNHIDVSDVTNMTSLFEDLNFDGDISKWDVSSVTNMSRMFFNSGFTQDISSWNVENVMTMESMFSESYFTGDISRWNTCKVTNMTSMFAYSNFSGDISSWDVSNVTSMESMFAFSSFTGNIEAWDVKNVKDMQSMFEETTFDANISGWNVENVENFTNMFLCNTNFNQDLTAWNIKPGQTTDGMFAECPLENNPPDWYK